MKTGYGYRREKTKARRLKNRQEEREDAGGHDREKRLEERKEEKVVGGQEKA
jgi:hypothetical protein